MDPACFIYVRLSNDASQCQGIIVPFQATEIFKVNYVQF